KSQLVTNIFLHDRDGEVCELPSFPTRRSSDLAMSEDKNRLPTERHSAEVAEFLDKLKRAPVAHTGGGRGRLIFALDATASREPTDRKSTRLNSSHDQISYAVFCLKKKTHATSP